MMLKINLMNKKADIRQLFYCEEFFEKSAKTPEFNSEVFFGRCIRFFWDMRDNKRARCSLILKIDRISVSFVEIILFFFTEFVLIVNVS